MAVDHAFFDAIGGPSDAPSTDLNDGDIIWLVACMDANKRLGRGHWEVLSLEDSSAKLLAAETVKRSEFEQSLRDKLQKPRWPV
ncbi:MAG: hypothetical protein GDA36_08590 [Rhodobacteraceae bacterium]|nr:hypothetical protein [Paracoccaceae bacterium]